MQPRHANPPRPAGARALAVAFLALVALAGCARRVGDGCTMATDCSINGDRICDLSQLGGYCTLTPCDPDSCPDDARCIEFESSPDRLARRYCMKTCNVDTDCRGGYECRQPTLMNESDSCPATGPGSGTDCTRSIDLARDPNTPTGYCVQQP